MVERIISKVIVFLARFLGAERYKSVVVRLIQKRAQALPYDEALRFLFSLDAALYALQGPLAVLYGGGEHTKHRHTGYHNFFINRIGKGDRVLDVGCGVGIVANELAEKSGAIVDGIDHSTENVAEAQRRFSHPNLSFSVKDALTMEVEKPYDVILLSNVLEHLTGRPDFLRRVVATSKAKRVFIRVPLFERDWRVPLKKELGVEWRLDPDHKTEYTLEGFEKEMQEAGLKITHLEVHWGEIWSELAPA